MTADRVSARRARIPDAARVLIGLALGFAIGIAIAESRRPSLLGFVSAAETIGTLWVNAIRMTVVPLVGALLISRIAGTSSHSLGKLATRALSLFVLLAAAGAFFAVVVAPTLVDALPLDPATLDAIRARAVAPQVDLPPFREWLTSLVPPNPVKAAADGALLPFVIFIVCFALALTRIEEEGRQTVVRFFDAVARTMFVLVIWIVWLSPLGVFALGLGLAGRGGVGVASAVGLYVVLVAGLLTIATAALYPVAAIAARVPLRQFVRACAPVQAIAFSTRSSFASLPVLIDRAERALGVSPEVSGLVLPVAVSIFKFGMPAMRVTGTCFIARLFGIPLDSGALLALAGALTVASFYTPGVPSGSLFILAPIYDAFGLPAEGIGLLLAVDLVPDMFVTVANVTGDMTVVAVLSRPKGAAPQPMARELSHG